MTRLSWCLALGLSLTSALPSVWAFSFSVEPSRIELSVPAGKRRGKTVAVDNSKSDQPVHLKIYIQDVAYLPDGTNDFLPVGATAWSCASWLQMTPTELDIPAGRKSEIRVSALVPEGARGGHYAIVFFETGPSYTEKGIGVNFRIGALVEITVPNTETYQAKLANLTWTPSKHATVSVFNQGNTLVRPKGRLKIVDGQGKVVVQQAFNPNRLGVLPGTTRQFDAPVTASLPPGAYRLRAEIDYESAQLLVGELAITVE